VDGSRDGLLHLFRHRKDAVLLGTDAFVENLGAGDTLPDIVAVTKLPFPVPSDPLTAAALERIQEAGENPLYDYLLPTAILRLKQELGRLPTRDGYRPALWILDPRLCTEKYARAFLRGLGREATVCGNEEDLIARTLAEWEPKPVPAPKGSKPAAPKEVQTPAEPAPEAAPDAPLETAPDAGTDAPA
jgi:Rad3-related DNA helicase